MAQRTCPQACVVVSVNLVLSSHTHPSRLRVGPRVPTFLLPTTEGGCFPLDSFGRLMMLGTPFEYAGASLGMFVKLSQRTTSPHTLHTF